MSKSNTPAFRGESKILKEGFTFETYSAGLSKREYFAIRILGGLLAQAVNPRLAVINSVEIANQLIEELNKKED